MMKILYLLISLLPFYCLGQDMIQFTTTHQLIDDSYLVESRMMVVYFEKEHYLFLRDFDNENSQHYNHIVYDTLYHNENGFIFLNFKTSSPTGLIKDQFSDKNLKSFSIIADSDGKKILGIKVYSDSGVLFFLTADGMSLFDK